MRPGGLTSRHITTGSVFVLMGGLGMERVTWAGCVAGALVVVFAAGAVHSAPPNLSNAESIAAWLKENAVQFDTARPRATWGVAGGDPDGLQFTGVIERNLRGGIARIGMRTELFEAATMDNGRPSLSQLVTLEVDCGRSSLRPVKLEAFEDRNLAGSRREVRLEEPWAPVAGSPSFASMARAACTAALPNPRDDREITTWMDQARIDLTVDEYRWFRLSANEEGVSFIRQVLDRESTTAKPVPIIRTELFAAKPAPGGMNFLSQTTDYELLCNQRTYRKLKITYFESHNLSGRSESQMLNEDMRPAAGDPIAQGVMRESCDAVQLRPGFMTSPD